jgi:hypothetical protein
MAKSQKRNSREPKKPKTAKNKVVSTTPFATVPASGRKPSPVGADQPHHTK